ncbi:hypothetical protein [Paraburkholderia susongensis]|uniref:hypothetical protein n=1 Tax=Paraburkholderia susongensis TaxID=1515439 RepID=UPI000A1CD5E7|nr:hypothetical protein [Paraburkholderia susongensis]
MRRSIDSRMTHRRQHEAHPQPCEKYAHLLNARGPVLDAVVRGKVLDMKPGTPTDAEAKALAKRIVAANEWRFGKQ